MYVFALSLEVTLRGLHVGGSKVLDGGLDVLPPWWSEGRGSRLTLAAVSGSDGTTSTTSRV